ncbi:hypothetical protein M595_6037 [Lyngbya aestuarii BL J]|uniref:Uncharacterized protein n=1 Tax=Lyngbya aestuarii BL J TaxID=1348334 RepID=U7QAH4_9CYAN|nr:hypothetical protein [Lyngbya aestuarii]ERT04020.1 hypothetical protein M595_6037 [Lyngbya aestuarii BL J]
MNSNIILGRFRVCRKCLRGKAIAEANINRGVFLADMVEYRIKPKLRVS